MLFHLLSGIFTLDKTLFEKPPGGFRLRCHINLSFSKIKDDAYVLCQAYQGECSSPGQDAPGYLSLLLPPDDDLLDVFHIRIQNGEEFVFSLESAECNGVGKDKLGDPRIFPDHLEVEQQYLPQAPDRIPGSASDIFNIFKKSSTSAFQKSVDKLFLVAEMAVEGRRHDTHASGYFGCVHAGMPAFGDDRQRRVKYLLFSEARVQSCPCHGDQLPLNSESEFTYTYFTVGFSSVKSPNEIADY